MWELLPKIGFVRKHPKTQTKAFLIFERILDTKNLLEIMGLL